MAESSEYLMTGVIFVPLQSLVYSLKRIGAKTVAYPLMHQSMYRAGMKAQTGNGRTGFCLVKKSVQSKV